MAELRQVLQSDVQLYATVMERIRARLAAAQHYVFIEPNRLTIESAILQIRLAYETLALSSLVTNRVALEEVAASIAARKHNEALKMVARVNPDFWPHPTTPLFDESGEFRSDVGIVSEDEAGYLHKEDYLRTWGSLSAWLHAESPFQALRDTDQGRDLADNAAMLLARLLNNHVVQLADVDQRVVCTLNGPSGPARAHPHGPLYRQES